MDRTKGLAACMAVAATLLVAGVGGAGAASRFTSCGSRPNRLEWNLEARGTTCKMARRVAYHGVSGKPKKVRTHVFRYTTPTGWSCVYTVFHSTHAQDGEGEIFDCAKGSAAVRWSDSPAIKPHALR
ncbi:MAG TPA: hypothetical protein VGI87_16785 [Solirubrobacteraceae bacterium]|jgi:hypothetical protein